VTPEGGAANPMRRPRLPLALLLVGAVVALSACAAGPNTAANVSAADTAGFWLGLWHGIICPVTFVVSLFTDIQCG
jgi:hypothetical protein